MTRDVHTCLKASTSRTSTELMINSRISSESICKVVAWWLCANAFKQPMYGCLLAFDGVCTVRVGLNIVLDDVQAGLGDNGRDREAIGRLVTRKRFNERRTRVWPHLDVQTLATCSRCLVT